MLHWRCLTSYCLIETQSNAEIFRHLANMVELIETLLLHSSYIPSDY